MLRLLLLWGLWARACSSDGAHWKDEDYEDSDIEVEPPTSAGSVRTGYGGEAKRSAPAVVRGDWDRSLLTAAGRVARAFKNDGANSEAGAEATEYGEYDSSWKKLVTGSSCPATTPLKLKSSDATGGAVTCEKTSAGGRRLRFPAGKFDIDEQVAVPANTEIVGNANPVDPDDKEKEPDVAEQTYFVATRGITEDKDTPYCGTGGNMGPGDAEALRIGFLLNSNTTVKYISYQGKDTVRPNDNGNLCGGGVFETPGCVSPGYGDGVGGDWVGKTQGCYDHTGEPNDLILGDGKGVENVLVDSVRLNGLLLPEDGDFVHAQGSQVAVWVAMTQDGSATRNVRIKNLVSMFGRGDGINLHGNVQDSIVEDCYIANTGDDAYAAWGAYADWPAGNVFRNNVAKNVGVARNYGYGVCMAVYGARDVTVTGMRCIDLGPDDWNPGQDPSGNEKCEWGPNCNSALAIIHDGWFGAVYPEGNTINIYDNEYVDFDGNPITGDRPQVRLQGDTSANYVSAAPLVQQASMLREPINTGGNSSLRGLLVMVVGCAVAGLMATALALRGRTRAVAAASRRAAAAAAQAADSGSSAAEGGLLLEPE